MPWTWPITVAILVQVVLPLWFLASLALAPASSYAVFYTNAAAFGLFFVSMFFTGRWDLIGVWLRIADNWSCSGVDHRSTSMPPPLWPRPDLRSLVGIAVNLVAVAWRGTRRGSG